MVEVRQMSREETERLLARGWYGHLGVTRDGHPYVVPLCYAYDAPDLYFFTTEGTKTEFIVANHEVCFQVEEVHGPEDWQSVMPTGRAELLREPGAWTRLSHIALYRLRPGAVYGRKTAAGGGG